MRMRLIAYVCDGSCVKRQDDEGVSHLRSIYIRRPDGCRWAIVQVLDMFWAIDLYDCSMDYDEPGERLPTVVYGKHLIFPTEDAAIAAAILTY